MLHELVRVRRTAGTRSRPSFVIESLARSTIAAGAWSSVTTIDPVSPPTTEARPATSFRPFATAAPHAAAGASLLAGQFAVAVPVHR